jgi:hypothetical protein
MNIRLILGSALAVQVVLALGLVWQGNIHSAGNEAEPWLDFPSTEVSKIVVADSSNTTTLELKDGQWSLVDPALPANSTRISTLLTTLDGLKTTWPVVSTEAGRERFEVTAEKHQRQLSLYKGDTLLGEYYFGTSPGFRQTHARRADDDEVYALAFNNFDLPADSNDWLDKALLSAKEPVAIKGPDYALVKTGDAWQFDIGSEGVTPVPAATAEETATPSEVAAGGEAAVASQSDVDGEPSPAPSLNLEAANKLATALTSLRVMRVADNAPASEPVVLEVKSGENALTYRFSAVDNNHYVQRSDREQVFTLSETDYKAIAGQSLATLTTAPAAEATDNAAAGAGTDSGAAAPNVQIPAPG